MLLKVPDLILDKNNSIMIIFFNILYNKLAISLVEWVNRTFSRNCLCLNHEKFNSFKLQQISSPYSYNIVLDCKFIYMYCDF